MISKCDECMNYDFDDDYNCYVCLANLDEDDMAKFILGNHNDCPFYRPGDEYSIVRKQN